MKEKIEKSKWICVIVLIVCMVAAPIVIVLLIWFFTPVILKIAGTILVLGLSSYGAFNLLESIED